MQCGERHPGSVITAHTMHAASGRSGCGADVEVPGRRRIASPCRPKQELAKVDGAADDVTTDEVGVHGLEVGGRKRRGAAKYILENPARSAQSDLPVCLTYQASTHWERGNKPTPCVCLSEHARD